MILNYRTPFASGIATSKILSASPRGKNNTKQ